MRRRDIVAAALGAVAATVLAGGVAWAAIPGPSGVIQGCYDSGGNVKVVEALPCPRNYTALHWNQQGPQGLQGPQGIQGPKGEIGERGVEGPQGAQGPPGQDGSPGEPGATGAVGPTGPQGPAGSDGVSGYEIAQLAADFLDPFEGFTKTVRCAAGKRALGGGWSGTGIAVDDNGPTTLQNGAPLGDGWRVSGTASPLGGFIVVTATCASVSP